MARLRDEDVREYPGFYSWLKNDFPQVLSKKQVMTAFTKYYVNPRNPQASPRFPEPPGAGAGSRSPDAEDYEERQNARALVEKVIRYGSDPEIRLMSMGCRTRAPGTNEPIGTHPPSVEVALTLAFGTVFNRDVAALVEYVKTKKFPAYLAESGVKDIVKGLAETWPAPDILRFAEATILHEMIHWRHWQLGLLNDSGGKKDYITEHFGNIENPSYDFEREAYCKTMHLPSQICNKSNTDV